MDHLIFYSHSLLMHIHFFETEIIFCRLRSTSVSETSTLLELIGGMVQFPSFIHSYLM